ncbi:unnamed protein product, partial [marine sediment metagenome]
TAKIYIDGVPKLTSTNGVYSGAGNNFILGGDGYEGGLDDVRIYDKPLTEQEIQDIMNGN